MMSEPWKEYIKKQIYDSNMPDHTKAAMERYLVDHLRPGGFLEAVMKNDLSAALSRADTLNSFMIKEIVSFVDMYVPQAARRDGFDSWCQRPE